MATDSWRASCGTDGKWTGAATLADSPVFFKEDCFHRVYPSASGAHQVVVQKCAGVQKGSSKSLVVVDDRLYYKSRMGVCVYDGSLPQEIGGCFGTVLYANAAAGGVRGKYFISMEDGAQLVAVRLRHAQGSVAPGGQHARKRVCAGRRRAVFP